MNGRILILTLAAAFPLLQGLRGQQSASDASFIAPVPKAPNPKETPSETPEPSAVTGVVAEALKLKKPLQMVNPLAPKKYGDGHDSVTWDPDNPEKPKGIIIFGIQW